MARVSYLRRDGDRHPGRFVSALVRTRFEILRRSTLRSARAPHHRHRRRVRRTPQHVLVERHSPLRGLHRRVHHLPRRRAGYGDRPLGVRDGGRRRARVVWSERAPASRRVRPEGQRGQWRARRRGLEHLVGQSVLCAGEGAGPPPREVRRRGARPAEQLDVAREDPSASRRRARRDGRDDAGVGHPSVHERRRDPRRRRCGERADVPNPPRVQGSGARLGGDHPALALHRGDAWHHRQASRDKGRRRPAADPLGARIPRGKGPLRGCELRVHERTPRPIGLRSHHLPG